MARVGRHATGASRPASTDENAVELYKREEKLFKKKQNLDALNQELAYNFNPWRADFTVGRCLGEEYAEDLFDSSPVRACRDLANARAAMLRPSSQKWFKATLIDRELAETSAVSRHLDRLNDRARAVLYDYQSAFVNVMKIVDKDLVTFGNAVHSCEPGRNEDGLLNPIFCSWHLRDCVWLDDYHKVKPDYLARRFKCSARHIRTQFKNATLHPEITAALEDDPDKEFRLCHTVMLADEYDFYKKDGGTGKWASVYYDSEHRTILRERLSPRFPYCVSRWERLTGSQYAISPAALTELSDARGMQVLARVLLEAGEKALDPPVKATQGAVLGEVNNYGGGVTWVKADYDEKLGPAIELLAPRTNPPSGVEMWQMVSQAMRDGWYLSQLRLPQTHEKTAYEASLLYEEFVRANSPLFEQWESDTAMMLDQAFNVMIDAGSFGDPRDPEQWPQELRGRQISFEFNNALKDAIEKAKVPQATTILGLVAGGRQADPEMENPIDVEQMVADGARGTGGPARWIKDLDQTRQQKAAKQAAATQQGNIIGALDQAGQAADVVKTGTEAAANLQGMNGAAAPNGAFSYGP
jgi:hypothetical protein